MSEAFLPVGPLCQHREVLTPWRVKLCNLLTPCVTAPKGTVQRSCPLISSVDRRHQSNTRVTGERYVASHSVLPPLALRHLYTISDGI
ncbi:hypothetical protein AMECASPLE_030563 [Ameca splendens]|uniref:Uncharacterized protein n=1 Tax=Ameca splendens TaxID=208324 RepID=A0ABV0ZQW5_9TELE